jgi:transcriptional regulator of acetoin/glycerol metabolism
MDYLVRQEWKGNVRELQHTVERAVVLSDGGELGTRDFQFDVGGDPARSGAGTLQERLDATTRDCVVETLRRTAWNKQHAADRLGIDRTTLYRLMKKHGIEQPG